MVYASHPTPTTSTTTVRWDLIVHFPQQVPINKFLIFPRFPDHVTTSFLQQRSRPHKKDFEVAAAVLKWHLLEMKRFNVHCNFTFTLRSRRFQAPSPVPAFGASHDQKSSSRVLCRPTVKFFRRGEFFSPKSPREHHHHHGKEQLSIAITFTNLESIHLNKRTPWANSARP
jgi:hypothetical protein